METHRETIERFVVGDYADDRGFKAYANASRHIVAGGCLELANDGANNLLLKDDWTVSYRLSRVSDGVGEVRNLLCKAYSVFFAHISDYDIKIDLAVYKTTGFAIHANLEVNPENLRVRDLAALRIVIQIEWSLSVTALLNFESGGRSIICDFRRVRFGEGSWAAGDILVQDII